MSSEEKPKAPAIKITSITVSMGRSLSVLYQSGKMDLSVTAEVPEGASPADVKKRLSAYIDKELGTWEDTEILRLRDLGQEVERMKSML